MLEITQDRYGCLPCRLRTRNFYKKDLHDSFFFARSCEFEIYLFVQVMCSKLFKKDAHNQFLTVQVMCSKFGQENFIDLRDSSFMSYRL